MFVCWLAVVYCLLIVLVRWHCAFIVVSLLCFNYLLFMFVCYCLSLRIVLLCLLWFSGMLVICDFDAVRLFADLLF